MALGEHVPLYAHSVQRRQSIRPKRHSRPNLSKLPAFLKHPDGMALPTQRKGRSEPTNSSANDGYLQSHSDHFSGNSLHSQPPILNEAHRNDSEVLLTGGRGRG